MKKITLVIAIAIISINAKAQSFVALYTFDSVTATSGTTDPSFVPTATGVTFGSFTAHGTPPNSFSGTMGRFNFSGWANGSLSGDSLYSQMTGVVADTEYYEVTISPILGYTYNLDSIKFHFQRSATGVRTYAVRSSIDGFVSNLTAIYVAPNNNDTVESGNVFFLRKDINTPQLRNQIVLGGASFSALSVPVTFRFYGWNSEGGQGTFSLDNVRIVGSATSLTIGIKDASKAEVSIYPNPSASGIFAVDLGTVSSKTSITVYDIIGKIILTKEITSSAKQTIDLSNQANGNYFINIKNDETTITRKITINK